MKKNYILLFLLAVAIMASGCSTKKETGIQEKIKASVTISPYSGLVKAVGGDKVEITVLVPPQSACETYEPTPSDIARSAQSSIYFAVGAEYAFEKGLLQGVRENYKSIKVIDCSQGIEVAGNNPHIWLYPAGIKKILEHIYNALSEANPDLEEYFRQNRIKAEARIDSIDNEIKNMFKGKEGSRILVFHPSWLYFAKAYNLEQVAIENEGKEPTAQDLKNVVDTAKKYKIKTLFTEPGTGEEQAAAIKQELKADAKVLNPMEEDVFNNLIETAKKISVSL